MINKRIYTSEMVLYFQWKQGKTGPILLEYNQNKWKSNVSLFTNYPSVLYEAIIHKEGKNGEPRWWELNKS